MATPKPTVFIASSAHHEQVAQALAARLEAFAEPDLWTDGQAELGKSVLQWALSKVDACNYGVFVFAPDPRWGDQINGNVLLELGLFIARHGAERCFLLKEMTLEVPADLKGIITADFDTTAFVRDGGTALSGAIGKIRAALRRRLTLADEIQGLWLEVKSEGEDEGRYSLVEFSNIKGELKLRGRSYDGSGTARLEWPQRVNSCWAPPGGREVYHTFDAEYGDGEFRAIGVSFYRFFDDGQQGDGYFVVHGGGGIHKGRVTFTLQRITDEFLNAIGVSIATPLLSDRRACSRIVKAVAAGSEVA